MTTAHRPDTVLIVDGTLAPTHDRSMSASSKNYRYSVNMQVVIDANARLTVAVGTPTPFAPTAQLLQRRQAAFVDEVGRCPDGRTGQPSAGQGPFWLRRMTYETAVHRVDVEQRAFWRTLAPEANEVITVGGAQDPVLELVEVELVVPSKQLLSRSSSSPDNRRAS